MFPITNTDACNPFPWFLISNPVAMYSPQPSFFYQQQLNPYHFQPSYKNNKLDSNNAYRDNEFQLNNSLNYYKKQHTTNFTDFRQQKPLYLPQETVASKHCSSDDSSKPTKKSVIIHNKNKNHSDSNLVYIDLSNIRILPLQEKLSIEELKVTRRKRWTKEEDQLLCGLKKNLQFSWREIAEYFPARTIKGCQFRISRLKSIEKIKRKH